MATQSRSVDAGRLDERILLQRPSTTQTASGARSAPTWQGINTVWARRLTERGVELFAGQALIGKTEIGFAIRYFSGHNLDATCRFVFDGRSYNIAAVVESIRHQELVLLGSAGANDGQ